MYVFPNLNYDVGKFVNEDIATVIMTELGVPQYAALSKGTGPCVAITSLMDYRNCQQTKSLVSGLQDTSR